MSSDSPSNSFSPRRILIVLLGSIGDVVRALPLLGRLRRSWPDAHIAWAVEPKSRPILEGHPWLDELIVYDRSHAPLSFIPFLMKVHAGHFDLALDLQRHLKSGVISLATGARDRIGFARANTKEFNHRFSTRQIPAQPKLRLKLMQYQEFADACGAAPAPIEFGLIPTVGERARTNELLASAQSPRVGVILGSSWPSRIYFPDATAGVIRKLARDGFSAVLLGGPGEADLAAEVLGQLDGNLRAGTINLAGRISLRDLIAIFEDCAAAFGPDSGPMHIAAAVGCPVVSVWGATAPQRSAPWGFADYAIAAEIPCHPCYLRRCPIGRECMRRIDPAAIAAMVRRAIASRTGPGLADAERARG